MFLWSKKKFFGKQLADRTSILFFSVLETVGMPWGIALLINLRAVERQT